MWHDRTVGNLENQESWIYLPASSVRPILLECQILPKLRCSFPMTSRHATHSFSPNVAENAFCTVLLLYSLIPMPAPWVLFDRVDTYGGDCTRGADPDIAGLGVVLSFVAASIITTTASILAMALDQNYDRKGRFTFRAPMQFIRETFIDTDWKREYAWRPFLDPLIIGLGDQQLVTGYAVLLSGWIKVLFSARIYATWK